MTSARQERRGTGIGGGSDRHRVRCRQVRVWAMAKGYAADPDALDLICRAKAERAARHGELDQWVVGDVEELLWVDLVSFCARTQRPVPERLPETLWTYLGYLADAGALVTGSDPLPSLRTPLVAYGGLTVSGRRRAERPARSARAQRPFGQGATSAGSGTATTRIERAGTKTSERTTTRELAVPTEPILATIIPFRPCQAAAPLAGE